VKRERQLHAIVEEEKLLRQRLKTFGIQAGQREAFTTKGFLVGEGFIEMTDEDVEDAKVIEMVANLNTAITEGVPDGICYIPYHDKAFAIAKHTKLGRVFVLGRGVMEGRTFGPTEKLIGSILPD
jgi:hypothetical protein